MAIPADLLEKHGRKSLLITAAIIGGAWIGGYWHTWSDLNFRLIYILFGLAILLVALTSWLFRVGLAITKKFGGKLTNGSENE